MRNRQRSHRRNERGLATIVALFSLLVLVMMCLLLGGMMATGSEEARAFLRQKETFYLGDAGTYIGKQLVIDNGSTWRPWTGSAYSCPTNWTGGADSSTCHYCSGTMTVGNRTGTIKIYVCQDGTTNGNNTAPCTDAPSSVDLNVLGIGTLSGA